MTVAELIERLREFPPDTPVYVWDDGDDYRVGGKMDPEPQLRDWGDPADADRGVYL